MRLLLLLRRRRRWLLLLLLRLLLVVLMMMMMAEVADVDGELGMRQLIEMGTRRRRRRRLMHMGVVTWLRVLGMRRREMVVMMGPATVRQQTMHGS